MNITTRLLSIQDAPQLAEVLRVNRDFMAAWEPTRDEAYYTEEGQANIIQDALARHEQGALLPHAIVEADRLIGRITVNEIVRGPFQSCRLGYWVSSSENGRGVATAAVRHIVGVVFGEMGLHRIEAGTLLHNIRSQRVLERNGFVRFGVAPQYLKIAGTWQDHALYQLLAPSSD